MVEVRIAELEAKIIEQQTQIDLRATTLQVKEEFDKRLSLFEKLLDKKDPM